MSQIALLVDDEKAIRTYISMVIEREGFQVLEAEDGIEALALLRRMKGAVNLLVTDVNMPRMTGMELVTAVKAEFPAIAVIYVSGLGLRDELHDPRGRAAFLQKPFTPRAIRDAVREVTRAEQFAGQAGNGLDASGPRRPAAMPIGLFLKGAADGD